MTTQDLSNQECFYFSKKIFRRMLVLGWIVDGRGGGLVLGRTHSTGNINMIQELDDDRFLCPGNLESGEYILNFRSSLASKVRLEEINAFKEDFPPLKTIPVSAFSRVLNTHSEPYDKWLLIDSRTQFIVNNRATSKHFQEIEEINQRGSGFLNCDLGISGSTVLFNPTADFNNASGVRLDHSG